ncbi:MAG: hypothetical protein ACPLSY_04690 [Moorellaceae bacterium]
MDGQGGILVVDRSGSEVKQVYFGSKVGTAPVIWRYQGGATVMVGTQGSREGIEGVSPGETPGQTPAIALLDAANDYAKYSAVTLEELRPTGEAFGTGVSGQISIGSLDPEAKFDIAALTHANGIYVWAMLPFDMKAEIVDTGVPAGEKAVPGQRYTAKVRFTVTRSPNDVLGGGWYGWVSLGAFHQVGGQGPFYQAGLRDASGNELMYQQDVYAHEGIKRYIAKVSNTGDAIEATFDWTAPDNAAETLLAAAVNTDYPPAGNEAIPGRTRVNTYMPEVTYADNVAEARVPVRLNCDLAVTAWPFRDPITIGWKSGVGEGGVNIKVVRKDDNPNPVTARVTVDGPGGTQVYTITVPAGGQKYAGPYRFQVYDPGTYTVHIEAWPEGLQDAYPPDNVADVVIHAIKKEPPYTGEKEPGLHVELGGM